jgi:hypothetical protein
MGDLKSFEPHKVNYWPNVQPSLFRGRADDFSSFLSVSF